jgi:DNA-binding CsgD family transcriptional regulator/tetratricopeptide (TPR) repeat protein
VQLLERTAELATLAEALDAVGRSSRGSVLFVGGEAGVGKTTLVRSFTAGVDGARVLAGACDPLFTPRPLGPLLAVADDVGGELRTVVDGEATPHEVAAALVRELRANEPTVFVLEDVHWADEATLDVVRLLARRADTVPALVLVTYRDDELDRGHPLRQVLGELATTSARRMQLAPLSSAAVAELAEPYGIDAGELYRKTAGNPFFVVEALDAGTDGIPATVRDAVHARAARLRPEARLLLDAVAVVSPRSELWLLEAIAPDVVGSLEECLGSGMLVAEPLGVSFRHELARLAVEESIALDRKAELHRSALAALAEPPVGAPDLARLAHHAEAAGDVDAVLRYAPAAGNRAAAQQAYREAAAQYDRALRYGRRLTPEERADLLERRSPACYLTDQNDAAIEAIEGVVEIRRELGQTREEGDALRWLSEILWCPGRTAEAVEKGLEAVALLETLPPGRELAMAYSNLAHIEVCAANFDDGAAWARRSLELAEEVGDFEIGLFARTTLAGLGLAQDGPGLFEACLEQARNAGLDAQVARAYVVVLAAAVDLPDHELLARHLQTGIDFCSERGLERDRLYLLAHRARLELDEGRWEEAAETAAAVLRVRRTSISPRIRALVVLALVRARRGDPGYEGLLDEAWALAEPTGELTRTGEVACAKAEAAWLQGDPEAVAAATDAALAQTLQLGWGALAGRLATWRLRAGLEQTLPAGADEPFPAERWDELGCPYEAALALVDGDGEAQLRGALDRLHELGARAAAAVVARRLRERGARGLPRGPRQATQQNPAGLTPRELEVLCLVAAGLRNAEIATQLVLSERTVGHHVGAILRKLDVETRAQAGAEAVRLGAVAQDR